MPEAYIVSARRTAGGRRNGRLAGWHPADLGALVLDTLVADAGIDPAAIDDVIIGCVSQIGEQTFAFGRNIVLASSLPDNGRTLLVSHGGIIELGAIASLPEADHASWGGGLDYCEGVRLSFDGNDFVGIEILRHS